MAISEYRLKGRVFICICLALVILVLGCGGSGDPQATSGELTFESLPDEINARLWPVFVQADSPTDTSVEFWVTKQTESQERLLPSIGVVQNSLAAGWLIFTSPGIYEVKTVINETHCASRLVEVNFDPDRDIESMSAEMDAIFAAASKGMLDGYPLLLAYNPVFTTNSGACPPEDTGGDTPVEFVTQPELTEVSQQLLAILNWWIEVVFKLMDLEDLTIYEDGGSMDEDGNYIVTGWATDGGPAGTFSNVLDPAKNSRVIKLDAPGGNTSWFVKWDGPVGTSWNNDYQFYISWEQRFLSDESLGANNTFTVQVIVLTDQPSPVSSTYWRYLTYRPDTDTGTQNAEYITHGLGTDKLDGECHYIWRNLEADLKDLEPATNLLYVDRLRISGNNFIDSLKLYHYLPAWPEVGY